MVIRLIDYRFLDDTTDMYNQVQILGDRQLVGARKLISADGGSVFTLDAKPHNVEVFLLGSQLSPGYIKNLSVIPPSGVKYLVEFDTKQVILLSGTNYGNNIPTSGGSVLFDYKISRPLIRVAADYESQSKYGIKEKIINDKAIKDPIYAKQAAKQFIAAHRLPVKLGEITLATTDSINVGETININLPHIGISGLDFRVQEVNYNLNKEALLSEQHLKLMLSTRLFRSEDFIHNLVEAVRELQAGDVDPEDIETQILFFNETALIDDKNLKLKTRTVEDSFIFNSLMNPPMNILQDIERPTNQNFERLSNGSVPSNWTLAGNANFVSNTSIHKSVTSAQLDHAAGSSATITSNPFAVNAGSRYMVNGWCAQTNNGSVYYQLNFLSGNGAILGSGISTISIGSTAFTRIFFSGIAPTGATSGTLIGTFNNGGQAGSAFFDVTQVTPFTGFGLLGDRRGAQTTIYNLANP